MSSSSIIAARPRQRPSGPSWSFVCHGRVASAAVKRKKAPLARALFCLLLGIAYGITAAVTPVCDGAEPT